MDPSPELGVDGMDDFAGLRKDHIAAKAGEAKGREGGGNSEQGLSPKVKGIG